ncbi:MAG: UDP-2,3-diacylglucosamine diphosphatase [Cellvibrionales bacterium]|nr:UDP-2,3-diacylglucosamine diphosphatase [Cellvibrionales bacterium]
MRYRLISDLHLDESRPDICQGFFSYLDRIKTDTDKLYILGDLFEAWVGDDDLTEFNQSVIQHLKQLSDSGASLYFMHGNRDFLLLEGFAKATGGELIPDPTVITTALGDIVLSHGDSYCTDDVDYQTFKANIRKDESMQFLLTLPLSERKKMASQLREDGKKATANKSLEIMDVNEQAIIDGFLSHQTPIMIHGHTHRPNIHTHTINNTDHFRYVLGDWHEVGYEIVVDSNAIELITFRLKDQHVTKRQSHCR